MSSIFSLDSNDGQSEITVRSTATESRWSSWLKLFTYLIRSLGASPVFCEYQNKPSFPLLHFWTSVLVLQLILTVSSGPAAVVEGLWVTLICPLLSETQQEEINSKLWQYTWRNELISNLCSTNLEQTLWRVQMKMMMKVMLMKIVVCVSDECVKLTAL